MQGRGNCQTPCPQQGTSPDRSSARVQAQLSSRARDLSGPRQPHAELPASANPAMPVCRAPSPSSSVVGGLGPSTTFFSHAGLSSVGSVASRRSARSLTAKETRAQLKQVFNEFAVPRRVPSSSSLPLVELFCRKCGGRREKVLDRSALLALFSHLPAMVFERFFDLLDEDGDQTVDVEEFLKGVDMLCGRDDQQLLRFLFKLCDLDGNGRIEREELRTLLYHLPSRLWRFSTGTIKKKNKKQQALLSVPGKAQYEKRNECRRRTVPPALDTSPVRREGRRSVVHFAADIVDTEDEAQQNSEKEEDDEGEAQDDDDDEERGDALVFDARDELVRKRIDEIVEAAFRCKQQKTRSRVRAATAPPRNLLGGDSCPGDMIPEDRGRKPSEGDSQASAFPRKGVEPRRAVHSGRPTSRDEGLTFEEFLSSLDSNREILDLLNFFYIQSVLSLFAPRGPPLTLSVSFASGGSTPADPTARSRSTSPHVQSVASTLEGRSLLKASSASSSSRENSASLCPPLHSAAARKGDQLAGGRRCSPSRSATAMSSREAQDSSQAVQEVQKLERAPASIELPESTSHRSSVNHTENSHHGAFTVFSVDGAEVRARGSPDQFRKEGSLGRSAARPPGRERFQSVGCAAVNRSLEPMEGEMLSAKKAESSARQSGRKLRRRSSWGLGALSRAVSSVPAFKRKSRNGGRSSQPQWEATYAGQAGRRRLRFLSLLSPTRRWAALDHRDTLKAEGGQEGAEEEEVEEGTHHRDLANIKPREGLRENQEHSAARVERRPVSGPASESKVQEEPFQVQKMAETKTEKRPSGLTVASGGFCGSSQGSKRRGAAAQMTVTSKENHEEEASSVESQHQSLHSVTKEEMSTPYVAAQAGQFLHAGDTDGGVKTEMPKQFAASPADWAPCPRGSCSLVVGRDIDCKSNVGSSRSTSRTDRSRRRRRGCGGVVSPPLQDIAKGRKNNRAMSLGRSSGVSTAADARSLLMTQVGKQGSEDLQGVLGEDEQLQMHGWLWKGQPHVLTTQAAHCLYLHGCSVHALADDSSASSARWCKTRSSSPTFNSPGGGTRGRFGFEILRPTGRVAKRLYAMTEEERHEWIDALQTACGVEDFHDFYRIHAEHVIGRGKFATVKLAHEKETGKLVAVKILKKGSDVLSSDDKEFARREMEVVKVLQHPNLIKTLDVFDRSCTAPYAYIVMELLPHRDLATLIKLSRCIQYLAIKLLRKQESGQSSAAFSSFSSPSSCSSSSRNSGHSNIKELFCPVSSADSPSRAGAHVLSAVAADDHTLCSISPNLAPSLSHGLSDFCRLLPPETCLLFESGGWLLKERVIVDIVLGLLKATRHMHSKGVVHRDLKPENLLLVLRPPSGKSGAEAEDTRVIGGERQDDEWGACRRGFNCVQRSLKELTGHSLENLREFKDYPREGWPDTKDGDSSFELPKTAQEASEREGGHSTACAPVPNSLRGVALSPANARTALDSRRPWRGGLSGTRDSRDVLEAYGSDCCMSGTRGADSGVSPNLVFALAGGKSTVPSKGERGPSKDLGLREGILGGVGVRREEDSWQGERPPASACSSSVPVIVISRVDEEASHVSALPPDDSADMTHSFALTGGSCLPESAEALPKPGNAFLSPGSLSTSLRSSIYRDGSDMSGRETEGSTAESSPSSRQEIRRKGIDESGKKPSAEQEERRNSEDTVPAGAGNRLRWRRDSAGGSTDRRAGETPVRALCVSYHEQEHKADEGSLSCYSDAILRQQMHGHGDHISGAVQPVASESSVAKREASAAHQPPGPCAFFYGGGCSSTEDLTGSFRGAGGHRRWDDADPLIEELRGFPNTVLTSKEREEMEKVVPAFLSFHRSRGKKLSSVRHDSKNVSLRRVDGQPCNARSDSEGSAVPGRARNVTTGFLKHGSEAAEKDAPGPYSQSVRAAALGHPHVGALGGVNDPCPPPSCVGGFSPSSGPRSSCPSSVSPSSPPVSSLSPGPGHRTGMSGSLAGQLSPASAASGSSSPQRQTTSSLSPSPPPVRNNRLAPPPPPKHLLLRDFLPPPSTCTSAFSSSDAEELTQGVSPSNTVDSDRSASQSACLLTPENVKKPHASPYTRDKPETSAAASSAVAEHCNKGSAARQTGSFVHQRVVSSTARPTFSSDVREDFASPKRRQRPPPGPGNELERLQWCIRVLEEVQDRLISVKVADFGLSAVLAPNWRATDALGTLAYAAPEVILGVEYDKAVDMWSIGVITFELLSQGVLPFPGKTESEIGISILERRFSFDAQSNRSCPLVKPSVPAEARDFVSRLLCPPQSRMTCEEALHHPWVRNADTSDRHFFEGSKLNALKLGNGS